MLRKIGLENFKCWRELDIELAPITLLFGSNSSGKSSVLQSLLMLKQTARGFDPGQHINFGGSDRDYVNLGSYQDLVYGHDSRANVAVRLSWNTSSRILIAATDDDELQVRKIKSIAYDVTWGIDEHIFIDKLCYDGKSLEFPPDWVKVSRDEAGTYRLTSSFSNHAERSETVQSPESCYILPQAAKYRWHNENRVAIFELDSDFERFIRNIQYIGPLRLRPERHYLATGGKPQIVEPDGANTIQALIASAREDRSLLSSVQQLLEDLSLVEEFDVKPIDTNERLFEATATIAGIESSLADIGFGVSQVLPIITMLLSAPAGSIILLEQPELHLHPNAQAALADLILYVAETRNLQLIVESHSEHIVRRLQRRMAEANSEFAKPENIKMYFCQPGEAGSTIEEVEVDRFGQISNWPEHFLGDISGDLHTMLKAALERRSQELESVGSGG